MNSNEMAESIGYVVGQLIVWGALIGLVIWLIVRARSKKKS
jgi:hypothetical protein